MMADPFDPALEGLDAPEPEETPLSVGTLKPAATAPATPASPPIYNPLRNAPP